MHHVERALALSVGRLDARELHEVGRVEEVGELVVLEPRRRALAQLREELADVAAGLRKHKTGALMNLAQKDVEDLLSLLINGAAFVIRDKTSEARA